MDYQQFATYDNMINSKHKFKENQMAYVSETKKVYQYKEGKWDEIVVEGGGVELSLYDMNKQIISQLPDLPYEIIKEKIDFLNVFAQDIDSKYFMLLCKDIGYYTLFIKNEHSDEDFGSAVISCADYLGQVKSIELTEDQAAVEIWFVSRDTSEPYVMYLFNYEEGIIQCTM